MYIFLEAQMQVAKWGNSLAVRLPTAVVEALDLKEGDQIEIRIAGEREFEVTRERPCLHRRPEGRTYSQGGGARGERRRRECPGSQRARVRIASETWDVVG